MCQVGADPLRSGASGLTLSKVPDRATKTWTTSTLWKGVSTTTSRRDTNLTTAIRLVGGRQLLVDPSTPAANVALIASHQRGRVARCQLLAAGISARMIRTAVKRHGLHRVARGVYAVGHLAEIELAAEVVALLAVGPDATLVGPSALFVHGVLAYPPVEVHVANCDGTHSSHRPGIRLHRYAAIPRAQLTTRRGLPVTTAERALLDSVALLSPAELERAFWEAIALRATSKTKVRELVAVSPGREGCALLRSLADPKRRGGRSESPPEQVALDLIRAAGLPEPVRQAPLHGFKADLYWPEAGVVMEIDGEQFHNQDVRPNFVRDRRKIRTFQEHGLQVVPVAPEELERPLPIIRQLTQAIAIRELRRAA
jgi:very-short-patch-repair endonuclease